MFSTLDHLFGVMGPYNFTMWCVFSLPSVEASADCMPFLSSQTLGMKLTKQKFSKEFGSRWISKKIQMYMFIDFKSVQNLPKYNNLPTCTYKSTYHTISSITNYRPKNVW